MKKLSFLTLILLLVFACGNKETKNNDNAGADKADLSGAGATFPQPFYNIIFKDYTSKTGNNVTYGGIGSGGGIRSLKDKTVDFGASDAYLSETELSEMEAEVLHIPTCMGAVVLSYNLKDVKDLKLTGELVADIFLGKITKWDDSRIKEINPGLNLPNKTITPVYRSDGSGTTFVFTDYLTKVSPEWEKSMGAGKSLKWKAGIAAKGNPGVAGSVAQTDGSIGYIGSEYALSLDIPIALLQNSAGNFVEPSAANISAAANIELPSDMRTMVTNSPEASAYPISCFTWIIVYKEQAYNKRSEAQANVLSDFLNYVISPDAQNVAANIHYAPLPEKALENAKNIVSQLTYNNESIKK
ncbi:MAG: phosphate ABC transporter substrate-binding protein PstS [Candidatus Azobacteroides sp.]|nr:phosphate ABC transporter substrate-binding protein PstS [Candidatus Azobacteroides sp.]